MRFFNTAGPVVPEKHYCIPPLERLDLGHLCALVRDKLYFVLYAPRQTGKTSTLLAFRDYLNSGAAGDYRCVYANVEAGQAMRENMEEAMRAILGELANRVRLTLGDEFLDEAWPGILEKAGPAGALNSALGRLAESDPRPLVLFIDEIDALIGDTLLSVLRQLRAGYDRRPGHFPHSVVLCGIRDVRDYRIHSGSSNEIITGGSAFNIKAESLRLGDFSEKDVAALLAQHTEEAGQEFSPEAVETVWNRTQGQPWLVNALAKRLCFLDTAVRERDHAITAEDVREAEEDLILARETHLDQLADKLQEGRVRRVIEPLLSGADEKDFSTRDLEYVRDLGLIVLDDHTRDDSLRIANPIYAEVVPRELTYATQAGLTESPARYVAADGSLDLPKLLAAFQEFFREHSEHWLERFEYKEAGPQLLLQAFLQRIVNGGGRVEREYGLGNRRTDLLIVWPQGGVRRKYVIECKLLHKGLEPTIRSGLEQTAAYMDRCAAESGHLVIFDRDEEKKWEDRIFRRRESHGGVEIEVWGM
ncbi:MAG: ATP-binding protein [Gammaproteobacteria bacterium]|nr:ATP-binding protein [Gammaproteobacteria bacterium]